MLRQSFACSLFHAGFLLGLLFNPEDWGDMLPWNAGWLSMDCTALYPKRQNSYNDYTSLWAAIACCLLHYSFLTYSSTLKMEVIYSLKTFTDFQWTTWCYIPEDSTLHNHCSENLKYYSVSFHFWSSVTNHIMYLYEQRPMKFDNAKKVTSVQDWDDRQAIKAANLATVCTGSKWQF
jgi:hypothetical protein